MSPSLHVWPAIRLGLGHILAAGEVVANRFGEGIQGRVDEALQVFGQLVADLTDVLHGQLQDYQLEGKRRDLMLVCIQIHTVRWPSAAPNSSCRTE